MYKWTAVRRSRWGRFLAGVLSGTLSIAAVSTWADLAPRPQIEVTTLPAKNCPMDALTKAVDAKYQELYSCAREKRVSGRALLHCSFAKDGKVKSCEPQPGGKGFAGSQLTCLRGVLSSLAIPSTDFVAPRGAAACVLKVEVTSTIAPYRRPRPRPPSDLDLAF